MRDLTLRERAGLIGVIVLGLALCIWGWWHGRTPAAEPETTLETLPLPPGGVEVEAGKTPASASAQDASTPALAETHAASPAAPGNPKSGLVIVYVTGAVKRPGVYTLKQGDRIYKAIRAAGGFKKNAAIEALNLADVLQDGDQLNVPSRSARGAAVTSAPVRLAAAPRPAPASASSRAAPTRGRILGAKPLAAIPAISSRSGQDSASASAGGGGSASSEPEKLRSPGDGTVNINTADEAQLMRLPGVGASTAAKIVEYRKQIGRFSRVEQLMDVHGIGEKKLAAMLPFLRVD